MIMVTGQNVSLLKQEQETRQTVDTESRRGWCGGEKTVENREKRTFSVEGDQLLWGLCFNRQQELIPSEKTSCILCY